MASFQDPESPAASEPNGSLELTKIVPNTLYLTFNAPQVDNCHRGLFLTYPSVLCVHQPCTNGTLFHAVYENMTWGFEERIITDISRSKSLLLLFRISTIGNPTCSQFRKIRDVLKKLPIGREARGREIGETNGGNAALDGYDCVIWTCDALRALYREGLVDLNGRDVDTIMAKARALAGPEDARTMVGKDFGGIKVIT